MVVKTNSVSYFLVRVNETDVNTDRGPLSGRTTIVSDLSTRGRKTWGGRCNRNPSGLTSGRGGDRSLRPKLRGVSVFYVFVNGRLRAPGSRVDIRRGVPAGHVRQNSRPYCNLSPNDRMAVNFAILWALRVHKNSTFIDTGMSKTRFSGLKENKNPTLYNYVCRVFSSPKPIRHANDNL